MRLTKARVALDIANNHCISGERYTLSLSCIRARVQKSKKAVKSLKSAHRTTPSFELNLGFKDRRQP